MSKLKNLFSNLKNKTKRIAKKIKLNILSNKRMYFIFGTVLCFIFITAIFSSIYNYSIVKENAQFYSAKKELSYSELIQDLKSNKINNYSKSTLYSRFLTFSDIKFSNDNAHAEPIKVLIFTYKNGEQKYYTLEEFKKSSLTNLLETKNKEATTPEATALLNLKQIDGITIILSPFSVSSLITTIMYYIFLICFFIVAQTIIGEVIAGKSFSQKEMDIDIVFDDIIGYDEVKSQFQEIINYVQNKKYFSENDLNVPKGILLTGDPGVGKTMFAKAFANQVNASLFFASGADFAELYVGVGAKRVRALFDKARLSAPSVIFIDEMDAIGSRNTFGNDSERLSVINQLLTEMDGLNQRGDIFVIGTTNFKDKIDPALLRPGRIDKTINIPAPDKETRKGIIKKYLGDFQADESTIDMMAIRTQTYSGSYIKNFVDETKKIAIKNYGVSNKTIHIRDFNIAQENILLGIKQKTELDDEQIKRIAYHELGHALISFLLKPNHSVDTIAIESRGHALGFTISIPLKEEFLYTRKELLNHVCVLLGGRAAEELFIGDVTNGAADDLQKANQIIENIIIKFGMSDSNPLYVELPHEQSKNIHNKSERTDILNVQYELTKQLLQLFTPSIHVAANKLITERRISGDELKNIVLNDEIMKLIELKSSPKHFIDNQVLFLHNPK